MWKNVTIAGHSAEVFQPTQRCPQNYVLLYLHGVHEGKLSEQDAFTKEFEREGLVVVCPQTRRSWWTDRICPEFDPNITAERFVLDQVMDHIKDEFAVESPRVGLFGTSMGGQGALRIAYKYPDRFPVIAAVSPAVDFQNRMFDPEDDDPLLEMYPDPESARQESAILYIHPLNWPRHQFFCCDPADAAWFESSDRLRMKLSSLGVPFEGDFETSAGGHGFGYYNHMAPRVVRFLVNGLNSERLRIVSR